MEKIDLGVLIGVLTIIGTAIAIFYKNLMSLQKQINDKSEKANEQHNNDVKELRDKIHSLELETEKLRGSIDNQQQVAEIFKVQVLEHTPQLYKLLSESIKKKKDD